MLIALLSDLHVRLGPRWEEGRRVHRWALDLLAARRPDAILVGGDFHDARTVPAERNEGADLLLALGALAEVVGVYGNHDVPGDLDLYNRLASTHPITFYAEPTVHRLASGRAAVACVPWRREMPPVEQLALTPTARAAAEAEAMAARLDRLGAELDDAGAEVRLALSHVMLREAQVALGQPEKRGKDFELSLADFARLRAHAVLLGHVHASQEWAVDGAPVFYPGSTHRRSYGEVERKYVALVTVERDRASVEYVEAPATPLVLAESTWTEGEGGWGWSPGLALLAEDAPGAEVRFRYHVPLERRAEAEAAASALEARLRALGARDVKLDAMLVPTAQARAPEIAAASTIEEKLRVVLRRRGRGDDDPQHQRVVARWRELFNEGGRA
jgi:DNA repair exonuclease SbcCD nuclease subunit